MIARCRSVRADCWKAKGGCGGWVSQVAQAVLETGRKEPRLPCI